ncbi:hypothetical protein CTM88_10930 [Photobacterium aquimaris]|uniref:DUF4760 domain-containing protein n=1 Tax=Photobacterium aquimaris TaxID=512643 RepID=A0A2T3IKI2_9GAMM|nr:hypothetical protein [Photobacterium aquimaris]OBU15621.1 hypothetical protein AYY20_06595 [Photobacterium aquimaris]PSU28826.1 hypothetical protein CTM88_10930 [Photobacterium aquimaris]
MFKVLFETNFLVAIANVVMAILAIAAAIIAIKQLNNSKSESRIATAKTAYQEYLKLCFDYPMFADGNESEIKRNADDYKKYRWFVAKMLYSFEQIIESLGNDKEWKDTIQSQLKYHAWHLNKSSSVKRGDWDAQLTKLIEKAVKEKCSHCN